MMTPKLETGFWYKFISLFWCRGKDLSWEGVIGHWCSRDQGGGEVGWQMALLLFTKLFSPPPTNWVLQTNISDKSAPAVRFSFGESQKTLIIIIHLCQMMIFIIFSSRWWPLKPPLMIMNCDKGSSAALFISAKPSSANVRSSLKLKWCGAILGFGCPCSSW